MERTEPKIVSAWPVYLSFSYCYHMYHFYIYKLNYSIRSIRSNMIKQIAYNVNE